MILHALATRHSKIHYRAPTIWSSGYLRCHEWAIWNLVVSCSLPSLEIQRCTFASPRASFIPRPHHRKQPLRGKKNDCQDGSAGVARGVGGAITHEWDYTWTVVVEPCNSAEETDSGFFLSPPNFVFVRNDEIVVNSWSTYEYVRELHLKPPSFYGNFIHHLERLTALLSHFVNSQSILLLNTSLGFFCLFRTYANECSTLCNSSSKYLT